MKKVIQSTFSVLLALVLFSVQAVAYTTTAMVSNAEEIEKVAEFDESEIYQAFDDVSNLMATIQNDEDLSYSQLEESNSDLISNVSSTAAIAMTSASADEPPIVNAFLWGCLFNVVGMLVVGLTTDFDNDQIMKSAWGCLVSSVLFGGGLLGGNIL